MDSYKFIRDFNKITFTGICKKLNVDRTNVIMRKAKKDTIDRVAEEIQSEYCKLFVKEHQNGK